MRDAHAHKHTLGIHCMFRSLHPGQSADVVPEWGSPGVSQGGLMFHRGQRLLPSDVAAFKTNALTASAKPWLAYQCRTYEILPPLCRQTHGQAVCLVVVITEELPRVQQGMCRWVRNAGSPEIGGHAP